MDPLLFTTVILLGFFVTVICLVAITYRQVDVAMLALRILGKLSRPAAEQSSKESDGQRPKTSF